MGLVVKDLTKTFGAVRALDGISFQVGDGQTFGLLGRNGAGKTTTIRILLGIIEQDAGTVRLNGVELCDQRVRFGYLPEERGLYLNYTVADQLRYIASMYGVKGRRAEAAIDRWLDRFSIQAYKHKKVKTLSKGNRQKVQLTAALVHNPDVIILDEPFSGLDPVNIQVFKDIVLELKRESKTILFSSHRMEDIEEICDSVILLKNGREVLSGTVPDIRKRFNQNLLEIQTDGDIRGLLDRNHMELHGQNGDACVVKYTDEAQVQIFVRQIAEAGHSIRYLAFQYPSLHSIFLSELGD